MPPINVTVPALVRQRAEANSDGAEWLASLPHLMGELAQRWSLTLEEAYAGGTAGLVVAAIQSSADGADKSGRRCVVKIPLRLDMHEVEAVDHAVAVHRIAAGVGCAELLDFEPDVPALLLERLGPNLHDVQPSRSLDEVLDAIAETLLAFWRPVAALGELGESGLMTGADKAQWLASYIEATWRDLGKPMSSATIDLALAYCDERAAAHDSATAVLCHGDAHGWNTLTTGAGECKFVDPEGIVAERAADLAVPMREYNEPLLAGNTAQLVRERAEQLGRRCDVDPVAIWQWGHMERVSTALANLKDFGDDDAAAFIEVAERCANETVGL